MRLSADDDAAVDALVLRLGRQVDRASSACGTSSPAARASTDARSRLFCVYSRACSASLSERRCSWGADVGRWLKLICGALREGRLVERAQRHEVKLAREL